MAAPVTNPLQTNNTVAMALAYGAGVLASKFPLFDAATWNSILLAGGGFFFVLYTAIINRKTAVVATVANMPEVNKVELDKSAPTSEAIQNATPNNVTIK